MHTVNKVHSISMSLSSYQRNRLFESIIRINADSLSIAFLEKIVFPSGRLFFLF